MGITTSFHGSRMFQTWFQPHPPLILGVFIFWMGEGFQYAIMPNWWLRVPLILLGKCQEVARSQSQQVRSIGMWMRSRACVMGLSGSCSGRVDHGFFMFFLSPSIPQKGSNCIIYHDFSRILVLFDHGPTKRWYQLIATRLIVFFVPALVGL